MARAEAEGRSLWTDKLDERARLKLLYAALDLSRETSFDAVGAAQQCVVRDEGVARLSNQGVDDPRADGLSAILEADEPIVLSLIEALIYLPTRAGMNTYPIVSYGDAHQLKLRLPSFVETVRTVFREHRISFDLVDGTFVPFECREMHEAVVVPTLTLLGSRQGLSDVESAYRRSLEELHKGTPDDAVTDAATALQLALQTLGCQGESLGRLAKSAQTNGIISGYDRKLIDWVSADRSNKGDAHNVESASTEDAWLTVHVVGALILRITGGPLRGVGGS